TGTVKVDGSAAGGYLVMLERDEDGAHHFFVNRVTTGTDGKFDLGAAGGKYRLQILHPPYLSLTDGTPDPPAPAGLRRPLSRAFDLGDNVVVAAPDLAFHDYGSLAPKNNGGALPTHFVWAAGKSARLSIYGPGTTIGDPWYSGPATTAGASDFDGNFNT